MNNLIIYDILHKILTQLYFILISILRTNAKFLGASKLKKLCKTSDTIFILAPGSSINNYSESDFELISKSNSIGINNFVIHDFHPTVYLLETQPKDLNYFKIVKKLKKQNSSSIFIYKGFSSLSNTKFKNFINNIFDMPKNLNVFFAKDAYLKGEWMNISSNIKSRVFDIEKSDYIYNYISSLNYSVMLSYKLGYQNIVLCGFDMDHKYFYCEDAKYNDFSIKYNLCNENHVNIVNNDNKKLKEILEVLNSVDRLLKEKNGSLYVFKKEVKLSRFFSVYNKK